MVIFFFLFAFLLLFFLFEPRYSEFYFSGCQNFLYSFPYFWALLSEAVQLLGICLILCFQGLFSCFVRVGPEQPVV